MDLTIVSWNTRNLSNAMARPGVRGRDLELEYRIRSIISNLERWTPDIAFLLEAGPDGDTVASFINSRMPGYQAIASPVTEGESYVMISKSDLSAGFKAASLVGTTEGYRQGWMIPFASGTQQINLVVLHAPSPSHGLDTRLGVIQNVVQETKKADSVNPILFMGDLNIKSDEFARLNTTLTGEAFAFAGPGTVDAPEATSIRKFTTILKGSGYEATESQPYDQFWVYKSLPFQSVNIPAIRVLAPETSNQITWISNGMTRTAGATTADWMNLRGTVPVAYTDAVYVLFDMFRALYLMLEETLKYKADAALLELPLDDWMTAANTVKGFTDPLGLQNITADNTITLERQQYNKVKYVLEEFTFYQVLADSVINYKTGGKIGYELLKTSIYEHGISDHMPVAIQVSIPEAGPVVFAHSESSASTSTSFAMNTGSLNLN